MKNYLKWLGKVASKVFTTLPFVLYAVIIGSCLVRHELNLAMVWGLVAMWHGAYVYMESERNRIRRFVNPLVDTIHGLIDLCKDQQRELDLMDKR